MSPSRRRVPRPASVALSAAALLAMLSASIAPLVPGAAALDPSPDPSAPAATEPAPTPDPTPLPEPTPTAVPYPTSGPTLPPDPTLPPPPDPTPDATLAPLPTPGVPGPDAGAPPPPNPADEIPLYALIVPASLVEPGTPTPHTLDSLVSDGCGVCHRSHAASDGKLLAAAYRTDLKPVGESYQGSEFALCFTCHDAAPFEGTGTGGTNFDLHAQHLGSLLDADADPANAVCAECHYQLHATSGEAGSKLVKFAPNVVTVPFVEPWSGIVTRSCTLTCHGHAHVASSY